MKKINFNPGKSLTIFFVFFACVFFALGVWQIERGQAKTKIIAAFESNLKEDPVYLSSLSIKWDRVFVEGNWDTNSQVLVDNSINRGIPGYKVLTPLKILNSNETILVDRGWISQNSSRKDLPDVNIRNDLVLVSGILEDPELGFVLSENLVTSSWPKVSQTKNLKIISKEYNRELVPFILVADPVLKNSLEYIKIIPTTMMPAKHYGYSMTWFSMFVAICSMYIWLGFKKNEE